MQELVISTPGYIKTQRKENSQKGAVKLIKFRDTHLVEVGVNYDPGFKGSAEEVNIEELIANLKVTTHKQR